MLLMAPLIELFSCAGAAEVRRAGLQRGDQILHRREQALIGAGRDRERVARGGLPAQRHLHAV